MKTFLVFLGCAAFVGVVIPLWQYQARARPKDSHERAFWNTIEAFCEGRDFCEER